jgi:hypothetical protein
VLTEFSSQCSPKLCKKNSAAFHIPRILYETRLGWVSGRERKGKEGREGKGGKERERRKGREGKGGKEREGRKGRGGKGGK